MSAWGNGPQRLVRRMISQPRASSIFPSAFLSGLRTASSSGAVDVFSRRKETVRPRSTTDTALPQHRFGKLPSKETSYGGRGREPVVLTLERASGAKGGMTPAAMFQSLISSAPGHHPLQIGDFGKRLGEERIQSPLLCSGRAKLIADKQASASFARHQNRQKQEIASPLEGG